MVLPKPKFKKGMKIQILPNGGKGIIIKTLRQAGDLQFQYQVKYKVRKNSKIRSDWFKEQWLKKI